MKAEDDASCIPTNKETYIIVSKEIPIECTDKECTT